jgi:hypothetical protein
MDACAPPATPIIRTVRFFAPKWTARDIIHTRFRWIFREFAAILAALPHLQAIAMTSEDERVPELIQQSFASEQFVGFFNERRGPPSRRIELPNLTDLSLDDGFRFVTEYCPNIQRVSGAGKLQPLFLAQAISDRQQLQSLTLHMWISSIVIRGMYLAIYKLDAIQRQQDYLLGYRICWSCD